jgi:hypothetical protein
VSLENCNTDEDGQATHEECYIEKICSKPTFVDRLSATPPYLGKK